MSELQFERPKGAIVMRPRWRHLLFLHWDLDPQIVQKMLPDGLEVDIFENRAYVGLVPFAMEGVRPHFVPDLGKIGGFYENFAELNVRTYVKRGGVRGVWFFSLDAASSLAVLAVRSWFHLPYFKARMRFHRAKNGDFRYFSRRLWPNPKPALCSVQYRVSGEAKPVTSGSLEDFLVERYVLYSQKGEKWFRGRVQHAPYQIQTAKIKVLRENYVAAAGFARPDRAPHVLYSRGVDVEVSPLESC